MDIHPEIQYLHNVKTSKENSKENLKENFKGLAKHILETKKFFKNLNKNKNSWDALHIYTNLTRDILYFSNNLEIQKIFNQNDLNQNDLNKIDISNEYNNYSSFLADFINFTNKTNEDITNDVFITHYGRYAWYLDSLKKQSSIDYINKLINIFYYKFEYSNTSNMSMNDKIIDEYILKKYLKLSLHKFLSLIKYGNFKTEHKKEIEILCNIKLDGPGVNSDILSEYTHIFYNNILEDSKTNIIELYNLFFKLNEIYNIESLQ